MSKHESQQQMSQRSNSARENPYLDDSISRRSWLSVAFGGAATLVVGRRSWSGLSARVANGTDPAITVFASPSCQCCQRWVSHLEVNAFKVTIQKVTDVTIYKRKYGVPEKLWSCHTGIIGPYAIEGHVPVDLIEKMLIERPAIAGLAVPGMPKGAPGMESDIPEKYDVIAFRKNGETEVYGTR